MLRHVVNTNEDIFTHTTANKIFNSESETSVRIPLSHLIFGIPKSWLSTTRLQAPTTHLFTHVVHN